MSISEFNEVLKKFHFGCHCESIGCKMSLSYEFITGKRRDSKLLYIPSEKQVYMLKSTCLINKKNYYICYMPECKARVVLYDDICEKIKYSSEHNHPDQEDTYNKLQALNTAKQNWLASEENLLHVGVGGKSLKSVKTSYRQLCSRMSIKGPNERKKYKRRFIWRLAMEQVLLNIWSERADELRGPSKNAKKFFDEIAEDLLAEGIAVSPNEVKIKIYNLITKLKKEKKIMEETGNPSDWVLFEKVQKCYTADNTKGPTNVYFKEEQMEDVCEETEAERISYMQPNVSTTRHSSESNDSFSFTHHQEADEHYEDEEDGDGAEDPFKGELFESNCYKQIDPLFYAGLEKLNNNVEKLVSFQEKRVAFDKRKLELKEKKLQLMEKKLATQVELKEGVLKLLNELKNKHV